MQFEDQWKQNQTTSHNETFLHLSTTLAPPNAAKKPPPLYRNVTTSIKKSVQAEPTELRRNPYYYQIYYVYLNTIFASLLPLFLLLFFNVQTASNVQDRNVLEQESIREAAWKDTLYHANVWKVWTFAQIFS